MIKLKTKKHKKTTLKFRASVDSYTQEFYLDFVKFCLKKMWLNPTLEIRFKRNGFSKHCVGFVSTDYENKKYVIHLKYSDCSYREVLKILAHELTHIKQFIFNNYYISDNYHMWNGEKIISCEEFDINDKCVDDDESFDKYLNFPWEMEANENEEKLLKAYLRSTQYRDFIQYLKSYNIDTKQYQKTFIP